MEALKYINLLKLRERQQMLDEKFKEKMNIESLDPKLIKVAYLDEVGELIHELKPLWCYWKKNNKEVNKRRVLEELSDCLHFALSYDINRMNNNATILPFFSTKFFKFEKILNKLTKAKNILFCIYHILDKLEYTEEEFLEVHHQVWLNNMNIRTGDDY